MYRFHAFVFILFRVNDYIAGGLDGFLVDPDNGRNVKRKLEARGIDQPATLSTEFTVPPDKGWVKDLTKVPAIDFGSMWHFLVNQPHLQEKARGTDKQFGKGYRIYRAGHIQSVEYHPMSEESPFVYLKASILPSMKKANYKTYISIRKSNLMLQSAYCTCIAGLSGLCCHVAAFLYGLSESKQTHISHENEEITCTSLPQQWNIPSRRVKQKNMPIQQVVFVKHRPDKPKTTARRNHHLDPRQSHMQKNNAERVLNLRGKLDVLKCQGKSSGFLHVLPFSTSRQAADSDHPYSLLSKPATTDDQPYSDTPPDAATTILPVPVAALSGNQAKPLSSVDANSAQSCSHSHQNTISECTQPKLDRQTFICKQKISIDEAASIEIATRGQADNENWYKHRQGRITASVVGTIMNRRKNTPPDNVVRKILSYDKRQYTPKSCQHGLVMEPKAVKAYTKHMIDNGHQGLTTSEAGLAVAPEYSWLAASVDRHVHDPTSLPSEGCMEAKCPVSSLPVSHLCDERGCVFCLRKSSDGSLHLNRKTRLLLPSPVSDGSDKEAVV
ncbi:uncharacterized protein [Ptychodera flava]|uniref:uncharacterized protein n=1 Tax=Ptychodera flava TaxID=63121 RepID=UPI003969BF2B